MMTIIEDTRQQAGKHELKHKYFEQHDIKVVRSKLPFGDYANIKDLSVIIDTKANIQEVISNVTQQHKRFIAECDAAADAEIKLIFLVENLDNIRQISDLFCWWNPRLRFSPKATTGKTLAKILHGIEVRHGVKFIFCHPLDAGQKIIELLPKREGENE
jgi:ribosome-associated protein